ncbi:MAG: CHAT domain-containing protein, partial [candidate division KSB1 bacterium]|nr:CHAT domain-containing protein [candidate division KSB1 bacterium]
LEQQKSIIQISRHLHALLIAPFEKDLEDQTHLVIVPHGALHYLPFAALIDQQERYLIDRYSLSLSPSASLLKICLDKGEPFASDRAWQPSILAFGNPDLNDPRLELPFSEKEIESVSLFYPDVAAYLYQQATETKFKQTCRLSNIILLSCHGEFDPSNPLFYCLRIPPDALNDGRLTAHEIFQLELNAYLVTMSACETGLATISAGDEIIGLSRSFIYAGSASLLSSLWKVDDLATAVLIKRFFRYLKEGEPKAKALQKAIELVRNQINVHPVYWAAFNLTGDFR